MKGIIWDLDGTFYDPFKPALISLKNCFKVAETKGWINGWNRQRLKRKINGEELYMYRFWKILYETDKNQGLIDFPLELVFKEAWFGNGDNENLSRRSDIDWISQNLEKIWYKNFFLDIEPFYWVHDTLDKLAANGVIMGMISDSPVKFGKDKIKVLKLGDFFDSGNIIWNREKKRKKPGKSSFFEMSSWMNLSPFEILVVGDVYQKDGRGARNAGMSFLSVNESCDFSFFLEQLFGLVGKRDEL